MRELKLGEILLYGDEVQDQDGKWILCPQVSLNLPLTAGRARRRQLIRSIQCRRTACKVELTEKNACRHSDTGDLYCPRCARRINEGCGRELVVFPKRIQIDSITFISDHSDNDGEREIVIQQHDQRILLNADNIRQLQLIIEGKLSQLTCCKIG